MGLVGFNRSATFDDAYNAYACCFKGCPGDTVPELDTAPITFRINLNSDEIPEGSVPWIWGTFTGWQGGALEMTDEDFDGIWEVTQEVSGDAFFKYKYSLGAPVGMSGADYILEPGLWVVCTDSTMMETLTLETEMCGITDYFGGYDRIHVRSGEPEILDIVSGTVVAIVNQAIQAMVVKKEGPAFWMLTTTASATTKRSLHLPFG